MADFTVNKKQNLIDVCLQIYGTTQQLFKLANDNNLNIDSDVNTGDVLQYDNNFGDFKTIKRIINAGVNVLNPQVAEVPGPPPPPATYGRLYNWWSASDVKMFPGDWNLPTKADFDALVAQTGGPSFGGGKLKEPGTDHWNSENVTPPLSGFNAFGNGYRTNSADIFEFELLKEQGQLWGATETGGNAYGLQLFDSLEWASVQALLKTFGRGIRAIYNGVGTPAPTIKDFEGRVYGVVQIGSQYWTVQNWACAYLNDGTPIPNVTDGPTWAGLSTGAMCAYDNDENNV